MTDRDANASDVETPLDIAPCTDSLDPLARKPGILLVDLDSLWLRTLESYLRAMGAAVFVATSPREAIGLFRQNAHEVHLVLLDICMMDFPRTSLLPDLQLIQPYLVYVVMAIDPSYRLEKQLLRQGVGRILPKPPRVQAFAETVWDLARAIEHTSVRA